MSFRHIEKLNIVRDEFDAVRSAAAYVRANWIEASGSLDPVRLYELESAMGRLEATYIVRLTAGYEAIVYDALRRGATRPAGHKASGVELTDGLSGWLQDVSKAKTSQPSSVRRSEVREIKARAGEARRLLQYRNKLAHREPPAIEEFSFGSARACLNRLLDLIP